MLTRTLIVEDEPLSRQYICALLRNIAGIEILDTAATEQEAIEKINSLKPALLLLDIELHSGTGLEVARKIGSKDISIIFTTALDHHSTRIIRMSGMPFLQKPIDAAELEALIEQSKITTDELRKKQFDYLLETLNNENIPLHLHLPEEAETDRLLVEDILFIQSKANSCVVSINSGTTITTSLTLKDFEEMLCAYHFFRVNATAIINLQHASYKASSPEMVQIKNGEKVELSLKKRDAFLQKLAGN